MSAGTVRDSLIYNSYPHLMDIHQKSAEFYQFVWRNIIIIIKNMNIWNNFRRIFDICTIYLKLLKFLRIFISLSINNPDW